MAGVEEVVFSGFGSLVVILIWFSLNDKTLRADRGVWR
jgi:hypothetical protein